MKRFLTVLLSLFILGGFIFAQDFASEAYDLQNSETETTIVHVADQVESDDVQDFASEAEDTEVIETAAPKNDYFIGFNVSAIGIEPAFQWIHNDKLEFQTGVSFIQYGAGFLSQTKAVGLITPIFDLGYRTSLYFPDTHFSIGGTFAVPVGLTDSSCLIAGVLAVYLKASVTVGVFEFCGKTYIPLVDGYYSTIDQVSYGFTPAFADYRYILSGLMFTTVEAKVRLH